MQGSAPPAVLSSVACNHPGLVRALAIATLAAVCANYVRAACCAEPLELNEDKTAVLAPDTCEVRLYAACAPALQQRFGAFTGAVLPAQRVRCPSPPSWSHPPLPPSPPAPDRWRLSGERRHPSCPSPHQSEGPTAMLPFTALPPPPLPSPPRAPAPAPAPVPPLRVPLSTPCTPASYNCTSISAPRLSGSPLQAGDRG